VIYVESTDMERMEVKARSEGRTLVEWARETLIGKLEDNTHVPGSRQVSAARRGAAAPERTSESATAPAVADLPKLCRHKLPSCTVCG
jgi:hypothetical protein